MTQETLQKTPLNDEESLPETAEKQPEIMSEEETQIMSVQGQNREITDIILPSLNEEESDIVSAPETIVVASQKDVLYKGEVDLTKLDDHGYAIRRKDGTFVDAMCPASEFDQLLVDLGFNLIDRINWPLFHRWMIIEQAERGKHGIYLIERDVAA